MSTTISLTAIGAVLGLIAGTLMAGLSGISGYLSSITSRLGRIADALDVIARDVRRRP